MPFSLDIDKKRLKKMQNFFDDPGYKDYLENAISFNRKLNEERKMRIPYIDGQTGVAQRHYNSQRLKRERMPALDNDDSQGKPGQVLRYPQKQWKKKRYQYLKFYMQSSRRGIGFDPEAEMHTISQMENPTINEDSNQSLGKDDSKTEWPYYEDEMFAEDEEKNEHSDSDFEFEDYGSKKKKGKSKGSGRSKGVSKSNSSAPAKRRTHADNIPDSEKPFSCELCGARYKTRPGLTYHYNHSHKERSLGSGDSHGVFGQETDNAVPYHPSEDSNPGILQGTGMSGPNSVGGNNSLTPPSTPGGDLSMDGMQHQGGGRQSSRRSAMTVNYRESDMMQFAASPSGGTTMHMGTNSGNGDFEPPLMQIHPRNNKTMSGKDRAPSLGYCDFCLGDMTENKKTGRPEELCSCAECGRSGHPSCLQFTENMIISVKEYPWQCIECKACNLCGTSENDDQLLFCDDCDRGYHMYCLVPPIKEPPEGSWSCKLCLERFHKKS